LAEGRQITLTHYPGSYGEDLGGPGAARRTGEEVHVIRHPEEVLVADVTLVVQSPGAWALRHRVGDGGRCGCISDPRTIQMNRLNVEPRDWYVIHR
jgi:hypothetical protein